MAEALISAILEQLVPFLSEQLSLVTDAENEFRSFASTLKAIQAVLKDADRKQVQEDSVKYWLDQLKDVSYDMDAVLDEWNTKLGEGESEAEAQEVGKNAEKALLLKKLVCCFIPSSSSHSNPIEQVGVRYHVASRIKELNGRLDRIADEKNRYQFVENPIAIEPVQRETTSFKDISEVYGRDVEKEIVIEKLSCGSSEAQKGFEVIPVVGMGGIGKTSLAQLVYNDDVVINHFNKRIWVYATDPFDVVMVAKAIALALEVRGANEMANWGLQTLQERIDEAIEGKKFFLVLDDVWTADDKKWEPLKEALRKGAPGSRILVTSRKTEVALMMGAKRNMITLEVLSEEVCWTIFSKLAFSNVDKRDELEGIGRQIVDKCRGLPLVAKTLGSLMSFQEPTREDWNGVLKSELWDLERIKHEVFIPLMLSYYDLPPLEKRCFLFCSYFPKDHSIGRDDLIQLWLSQGYLSSKKNYWEQGLVCFRNLAKRSLFQNFEEDGHGDIVGCKMHDIVHDFALFLTENEFFNMKLNGEEMEINMKARHYTLLLENQAQLPSQVYQKKNLRALFVQNLCSSPLSFESLSNSASSVKTLTLSGCEFTHVPENIDKLIYLRYLNLSNNTKLSILPQTLCNLVNLQTLKLDRCHSLTRLPKGIGKLASLRHLHIWGTIKLEGIPKSLREVTNLQTLDWFQLVPDEKEAMTLQDLNQFNSLRGSIRIGGIGKVEDASEAEKAQLKNKEHLDALSLEFGECGDKQATALLEVLQPHPNLKSLGIYYYCGTTAFPSWMISLVNLKRLHLDYCPACEVLPPFGKLQSLESLEIIDMGKVERVGGEFLGIESHAHTTISFPKLKQLQFDYMPIWKEWEGSREDSSSTVIMPRLSSLQISRCYKLEALPNFLRRTPLKNLTIEFCPILEFKRSEYVNVEEDLKILTSESGDGGENAERWRHEERLVLTWPFYISKLHIAIYFLP
ncbi:hypothetical protein UlMin_026863 [Ulmus minor]